MRMHHPRRQGPQFLRCALAPVALVGAGAAPDIALAQPDLVVPVLGFLIIRHNGRHPAPDRLAKRAGPRVSLFTAHRAARCQCRQKADIGRVPGFSDGDAPPIAVQIAEGIQQIAAQRLPGAAPIAQGDAPDPVQEHPLHAGAGVGRQVGDRVGGLGSGNAQDMRLLDVHRAGRNVLELPRQQRGNADNVLSGQLRMTGQRGQIGFHLTGKVGANRQIVRFRLDHILRPKGLHQHIDQRHPVVQRVLGSRLGLQCALHLGQRLDIPA